MKKLAENEVTDRIRRETMSDEELYERLDAIRRSLMEEPIRCPGCDRPLGWIDELNPRCACGMPLFFPVPEPERI